MQFLHSKYLIERDETEFNNTQKVLLVYWLLGTMYHRKKENFIL